MRIHCITSVAIALLTEVPLVLRIYALYNKDSRILTLLISCLVATTISVIGISAKLMHSEQSEIVHFASASNLNVCILTEASSIYKVFWVPLLLNEALLVSLALIKWFQNLKVHGVQDSAMNDMVKDSVLYFFATFPFLLFILLTWTFGGTLFLELPVGFAVVMGSIMSQRLLVNVRKYQFGHPFDVLRALKGQSLRDTRRFTIAGCIIAAGNFD
ncbi:uncharacterized protein FOMMEDRAFT_155824 [Fomitiporia mediterranea MF3/22]|uniref:uncharacterized protein n=1 Tax=Fomitiporia mediterranea (strain MF3/22) TaxID=694068 RepID=UPI00044097E5|nr:uncharacterized protein FOMMEDRAFT_155824 [Fomitiporia mediterranea MF3/22]EJD04655.1 hypothetical protein FOMMEDRAFT_155824 [Fomitiporia mediterranea MF3/22]